MDVAEFKKKQCGRGQCRNCGSEVGLEDNFCGECGEKIKEVCNCWIKKGSYNCGEDSCPGYGLFLLEKSKSK